MHKLVIFLMFLFSTSYGQDRPIRLVVRGDDMGIAQSVNEACIRSFKEGIMTTVEVMVTGPWYLEAAKLLQETPGLDVGIHLALTSEWDHVKSRPLTAGRSFVDENGYFLPMVWPTEGYEELSLMEQELDMEEVEKELRAQIQQAVNTLPRISHITDHMGFTSLSKELRSLFEELGKEYGLDIFPSAIGVKKVTYHFKPGTERNKEKAFIEMLESMTPGDYYFLDHPGLDTPELRGFGHRGYKNVAEDRANVTALFLSSRVKKVVQEMKIQLITYPDLVK